MKVLAFIRMYDELGTLVQFVKGEYFRADSVAPEKFERTIPLLIYPVLTEELCQASNCEVCLWLIVERLLARGIADSIRECELPFYRVCRGRDSSLNLRHGVSEFARWSPTGRPI